MLINKYFKKSFITISCIVLICSIFGCVNTKIGNNDAEIKNSNITEAYKLKPLDPLAIRFNGIIEQQGILEVIIDEQGFISLLHLDPIKAAGLTTSELEEEIERSYIDGEIYRNVSLNVIMTSKVYYVQGEVMQPGQFQLASGTTLLQAIATARGYSPYANRKKVTITRQGKLSEYNMKDIEKDPSKDIKIEAGDVIKIWTRWY
tara:strand:- start:781 stop:1392 length:612 start_codon:yes stop_codon:yes gene_type:complete